ncbi:hypothetical protein BHY_1103 (plasmid) [Borrelia nietonii YOR]|uniref:Uncharacterized protein n=1 Tax=Borrelia nietonii YOR TaxID=1293576 RepID=W5SAC1_9SPIR|nr:hypothetical protein BHY_1103 [Borrelia nietonii YOR]
MLVMSKVLRVFFLNKNSKNYFKFKFIAVNCYSNTYGICIGGWI